MKIPASKVDAYVRSVPADGLCAVVYGPDIGLVSERADCIARQIVEDVNDPFRVVFLEPDAIKADPSIVTDEIHAMGFGAGRRLIRIREADYTLGKAIESALEHVTPDAARHCFVLITAGDLSPSGLRKIADSHPLIAALPCYHDDARDLSQVVRQQLAKHQITADGDVINWLSAHCQGDRLIVRSEIDKLALFLGEKKQATLHEVEGSIGQTTETTLDDISHAVMEGRYGQIAHHMHKASYQGIVPVMILRSIYRYITRIETALQHMQDGSPMDAAMKQLRPPVFWKETAHFKRHLQAWQSKRAAVWKAIALVHEAEICCKQTGVNDLLMCERYLMKIAAIR